MLLSQVVCVYVSQIRLLRQKMASSVPGKVIGGGVLKLEQVQVIEIKEDVVSKGIIWYDFPLAEGKGFGDALTKE